MTTIKPKVIFLIDGLQVGGAERSLLMLCQYLVAFSPIVIVLSNSLALQAEFENSGINVLVNSLPRNYWFKRNARKLKSLVDSLNPVIIHSSLFHSDMTLRYLDTPAKKVTGLVSTMYSEARLSQMSWLTRMKIMILKQLDRTTSKRIDLFIANSGSIRKLYTNQVGYSSEKIRVIYRGRNLSNFFPRSPKAVGEFLFVGRLIVSKGVSEAIFAFESLIKAYPNITLKIAGDGPEKGNLLRLASSLGLSEKVIFLGQVDSVPELLSEADFFLFPTHYEGLPGALIEAMMAQIPIICSDIPENKECVDDTMVLFHRVGDQDDLLTQMEKALTLGDWDIRTQRAYDFAAERFEIGKIAQQYEQEYNELLANKH